MTNEKKYVELWATGQALGAAFSPAHRSILKKFIKQHEKVIECLKYLDDPAADSFIGEQLIKRTLEELGEE